jgi:DegV family protein with EDD domain
MNKIALVTDSIACPTKEQAEKYQIEIVPINIRFEGKVYREWVDLTPTQAYQFLEKNPEDWATSAPSPGDFLAAYKRAVEKGAKEILCLTLPQKISATWNSARMAKEFAKTELPNLRIEVIDTETAAAGETLLVLAAARAIKKGKNFEEILQLIENLKKKVKVFLVLETIRYIYRSGRIPEVASKLGALLPLKPILTLSGGKIHFAGAATSKERGIEKLLKILKVNFDQNLPEIGLMHADCLSEAEELKEKIAKLFPSTEIFLSEFTPVMGYATGRRTLLIAFYSK